MMLLKNSPKGEMSKICYIIPTLHLGGAEHQTVNQLNYLHSHGIEVDLIILSNKLNLLDQLLIPKDKIYIIGIDNFNTITFKACLKIPLALFRLNKVLLKINPDIVLAILPLSHFINRILKLITRNKFSLWCYHRSMQFEANPLDTRGKQFFHQVNRYLSRKYDHGHIYISEAVEENISKYLNINNGHIIHNAIPEKKVNQDIALDHMMVNGIPESRYRIVIPGRLHPSKGHLFFLDALHEFLKQKDARNIQILIVGGGHLEEQLTKRVEKLGLKEQVYITGYVGNEVLLSFLILADLVCIPSINEGFGNVAIEALMVGATILASNTGGLPEIIFHEENGFLFEKENSEDLLAKLQMLYEEKVKLDPSKLVASYKEQFTLEAQVNELLTILDRNDKA